MWGVERGLERLGSDLQDAWTRVTDAAGDSERVLETFTGRGGVGNGPDLVTWRREDQGAEGKACCPDVRPEQPGGVGTIDRARRLQRRGRGEVGSFTTAAVTGTTAGS